jgi:hypothetical protein
LKNHDDNDHYGKIVELLTGRPSDRKQNSPIPVVSEIDKQIKLQDAKNKELELQVELAKANGKASVILDAQSRPEKQQTENESGNLPIIEKMSIEEVRSLADKHDVSWHPMNKEETIINKLNSEVDPDKVDWTNSDDV